tara:strand:- start:22017 stop:23066 length:1050 start_codon:yes stop_codon:yes gene_type:complete
MKAIEALHEAHKLAFSPFVFETAYCLLELNILEVMHEHREPMSIEDIASKTNVSEYGIRVLLEMAASAEIVEQTEEDVYKATKIGYFILRDEMTRVNLYFTHDVCYRGLFHLKESIVNGKAEGLKTIGDWDTIYQGLSILPEPIKKSWFDFDHFYSDNSFDDALKIIFKHKPKQIFDIGGNTGKWCIAATKHSTEVRMMLFDLPVQLKVAKANIGKDDTIKDRVEFQEIDLLDNSSEIPAGADVYWMSQFLDCFSESEIEQILLKIKKNMKADARIFIMETFIDNQRFPAATHSLIATSLYFTAMANGNSKMYSSSAMKYIVDKAGFTCVDEHHLHNESFHTILEIKMK